MRIKRDFTFFILSESVIKSKNILSIVEFFCFSSQSSRTERSEKQIVLQKKSSRFTHNLG